MALAERDFVLSGNGMHQVDHAAAKLGVANAQERAVELDAFVGGQEIRDIRSIGDLLEAAFGPMVAMDGAPSKKNSTGMPRMLEICCSRLAPIRFVPFSYF